MLPSKRTLGEHSGCGAKEWQFYSPTDSYDIKSVSYQEIYRYKLYRNLSGIRGFVNSGSKSAKIICCVISLLHNSVKILPWN